VWCEIVRRKGVLVQGTPRRRKKRPVKKDQKGRREGKTALRGQSGVGLTIRTARMMAETARERKAVKISDSHWRCLPRAGGRKTQVNGVPIAP